MYPKPQKSTRPLKVRAAALLIAAVLTSSCNLNKPNDATLTTDIKASMFSEPTLKSATVDVTVRNGEVTLTGQVPDDSARLAAYKIATETKGVSKVNDQMTVQGSQSAPMASSAAPAAETPARTLPSGSSPGSSRTSSRSQTSAAAAAAAAGAAEEHTGTQAQQAAPPVPAAPLPPQPRTVTVPAGSTITVRMIDSVDSSTNKAGQVFKASLEVPIVVDDRVIVPKGADAYVKLVNASSAGKIKGRSELTLAMQSILFQGKTYDISSSDVKQSGSSRGKNSAEKIGGGAVLGALIGGLAGGGKGAAIGAGVGAGAGTGVQVFTKGQQVKIPSETKLDFSLEQPFDITYFPGRKTRRSAPATSSGDQSSGAVPDASSDHPPRN